MSFGFVNDLNRTIALAIAKGFKEDIEMTINSEFYDYLIQDVMIYTLPSNHFKFSSTKNSIKWYGQNGQIKIKRKIKRNK